MIFYSYENGAEFRANVNFEKEEDIVKEIATMTLGIISLTSKLYAKKGREEHAANLLKEEVIKQLKLVDPDIDHFYAEKEE